MCDHSVVISHFVWLLIVSPIFSPMWCWPTEMSQIITFFVEVVGVVGVVFFASVGLTVNERGPSHCALTWRSIEKLNHAGLLPGINLWRFIFVSSKSVVD